MRYETKNKIMLLAVCDQFNLTLERLGGGLYQPPPEVFLRCTPNYEADRAEILHSLWGILCATFGKKILTGSCQVTEL